MSGFVREEHLARATDDQARRVWDMIVVGGGATGVGITLDAATRGYTVLLLEQSDFGKGTSSRSTKLVHGGVRYLKQGNISLVREALEERAILLKNAPHVVHELPFIIPCSSWWQAFFYGTGLKVYDWLAGKQNLSKSKRLGRAAVMERIPTLDSDKARAGILYHDGQFDDARLLIDLAQTAARRGACLLNYAPVVDLITSDDGVISGARWLDQESGAEHMSRARIVINATGPFCDALRRMAQPSVRPLVAASQGIHLVLPKHFLPGKTAMMVPKTSDGRVVFLIPWHGAAVLGTTDTAIDSIPLEPRPQSAEIDFLLETVAAYLPKAPGRADIQSVFTGIRPLVLAGEGKKTSQLSRDHTIETGIPGLVTITGGKWTTYRRMAEDCVDRAAQLAGLAARPCTTCDVAIAAADAHAIDMLGESLPGGNEPLDARIPVTPARVVWAIRHEMARTVEDVLARRTRALFLHAEASLAVAPQVARLMAKELDQDQHWQRAQLKSFAETATGFQVN